MTDENTPFGHPGEDAPRALSTVSGIATKSDSATSGVVSDLTDAVQQAGGQVREKVGQLGVQAGEKAKGLLNTQVAAGADFLGNVGRAAKAAADTLGDDSPQLAGFVRGMATSVSDLSDTVRGQSPDALLETASTYVRQNPALVLGAAAVCGFALTRLLQGGAWNGSRASASPSRPQP
jgi:ElaB/YqjD/DUF883 family membrane-anchored ribosome-binding protein